MRFVKFVIYATLLMSCCLGINMLLANAHGLPSHPFAAPDFFGTAQTEPGGISHLPR